MNKMTLQKNIVRFISILLTVCLVFSIMTLDAPQVYAADAPQTTETGQAPEETQPTAEDPAPDEPPTADEPQPAEETAPPSEEPQLTAESEPSVITQAADEPEIITEADGTQYVSDEIIVKFKSSASDSAIINMLNAQESEVLSTLEAYDLTVADVPEGETVDSFVDAMEAQPNVEYAQPNYVYKKCITFNDPGIPYQWYLDKIGVPSAWDITTGLSSVRVAVLDSGIDSTHPEFEGKIYAQIDTANNDNYAYDIVDGHGTHVSGIIAATANNSRGIAGIAPSVQLIEVDVFNGEHAATTDIIDGIQFAMNRGADIINMSLGGYGENDALETALNNAVSAGIVCIAAAGNDNTSQYSFPSDFPSVISVIATDQNDNKAYFSNYGAAKDISAPGTEILSTFPVQDYKFLQGTSMAAPVVSGVVALMLSANPSLTVNDVKNILYNTAVDLGPAGKDDTFANGRVDAYQAVREATQDYDVAVSKTLIGGTGSSYGTVSGGGNFTSCSSVTVYALPSGNYHFVRWSDNGTEVSTNLAYTFPVKKDTNLTAEFEQDWYMISATANDSAYGSVSGGGKHYVGTPVTLTATPNPDCFFIRWSENGSAVSTDPSYSFTATRGVNVTAEFAEINCTVSPYTSNYAYGSVSGGGTVPYGTSVTLTATPNTNYKFVGWSQNGSLVSTLSSYSFTATKSANYEAVFEIDTLTVSATTNNPSYGSVYGSGSYTYGSSVTLQAFPYLKHRFVRWVENGVEVSRDNIIKVTVTKNISITAEFAPLSPISISCTKTDATFYGGNNGSITATASSEDTDSYSYSISNQYWRDSGYFGNLPAGVYQVSARSKTHFENIATCTVTIGQPAISGIAPANKLPSKINSGTVMTVLPPAPPKGYTSQGVNYSTSDWRVAIIDTHGNVSFVGGGKVTVYVTAIYQTVDKKGKIKMKTITVKKTVTVQQPVSSISLNTGNTALARTQKVKLIPGISPATASNKKLKWTSSNPKVAAVSSAGVVTAKAGGTAVITCTATDGSGAAASCTVNVTPIYTTGVKMSKAALTVKLGKTAALKATVAPKNTDFKTVTWISSNPGVAVVDAKGKVRAVAPGTAVITATTSGGQTAACTVTVP